MSVLSTRILDPRDGSVHYADTVQHQERPWLVVGGWSAPDRDGKSRPARLLRPHGIDFQAGGWGSKWADYFLKAPISPAVIQGSEPAPAKQFEILESPDVAAVRPSAPSSNPRALRPGR